MLVALQADKHECLTLFYPEREETKTGKSLYMVKASGV